MRTMRFWLDRGVDGLASAWTRTLAAGIKGCSEFRNNPRNPDWHESWQGFRPSVLPKHTADQPETHEIVREMRALVMESYARPTEAACLIGQGEFICPADGELVRYYGVR